MELTWGQAEAAAAVNKTRMTSECDSAFRGSHGGLVNRQSRSIRFAELVLGVVVAGYKPVCIQLLARLRVFLCVVIQFSARLIPRLLLYLFRRLN